MPRKQRDRPAPLPLCKGPKLAPFPDRRRSIDFIRLLGCDNTAEPEDSEDSEGSNGPGSHGYVFEVLIGSKRYALKIFRFYDDAEDIFQLIGREKDLVSIDTIHEHQDPFYNECRAYGKLIEKNINGKVAARCYGYVDIPAEREAELSRRFNVVSWDRPEGERVKQIREQRPLRAIVKELLLESPVLLTEKILNKMLRDLRRMRRLGVFPMDVVARNYKGGLLVDFSSAMTEPHYIFDIKPAHQVRFLQGQDLRWFQRIITRSGVHVWRRAIRSKDRCSSLRSYGKKKKILKWY